MRRVILASHGKLAEGLKDSAMMIIGDEQLAISCYGLFPGCGLEDLISEIKVEISKNQHDTFIILSDLFGGSVCNHLASLVERKNVNIISGMNLCMLLTICLAGNEQSNEEIVERAVTDGKKNIIDLKKLWERKEDILYDQDVAY